MRSRAMDSFSWTFSFVCGVKSSISYRERGKERSAETALPVISDGDDDDDDDECLQ